MAESAGREIESVDPAYTSKTCSGCGVIFEHLKLSDRWVSCECGVSLDRDHNAAINVLNRIQWAGTRPSDAKLASGRVSPRSRRTLVRAECHSVLRHLGKDLATRPDDCGRDGRAHSLIPGHTRDPPAVW